MTSPVVVDGRLTREKLDELLAIGAEYEELDFKATLNLRDSAHRLGLLKDLLAMSNSGTGGYVVVGANDDGTLETEQDAVDASQFDSAELGQLLSKYVVTAPTVTSQSHEVDGRMVVLIHVAAPASGLPVIVKHSGEYQGPKRMKNVFSEGVIYVRDGTRNVAANDAHWSKLLSRYRESVVAETRENIDALIAKVVDGLGEQTAGTRLVPLAVEMENATFAVAVAPYFDSAEGENKVRRFLRTVRPLAEISATNESQRAALDKLTIIAVQSLLAGSAACFLAAIEIVHELYLSSVGSFSGNYAADERAKYWLDVLLRLLLIGATAVREQAWWVIAPLVDRAVDDEYAIWMRHAIVYASRAGLLSGGHREAAMVLVRARALAVDNPALAPGLEGAEDVADDQQLPGDETLLNALCQFDFLWCTVAAARHPEVYDSALFYPSCAALQQDRTSPIVNRVSKLQSVRHETLPNTDDAVWEVALKRVFDMAEQQSNQYGTWWSRNRLGSDGESFLVGRD